MSDKKLSLAQAFGITKNSARPPEETDIKLRPDRLGIYFKKYLKQFVFMEFSEEYLSKSKAGQIMKGVPVPLRKEDIETFAGGNGLKPTVLAENMAWVMGCDPHFKYNGAYREFLMKVFNYKIYEGMLKKGRDAAESKEYEYACIQFRASLCMQPDYLHGMYSYARVCREMYQESSNREYIGKFKAESLEFFELLTEEHPKFAQSYYYLGYAYLNMGLYAKANAAWKTFTKLSRNGKDRKEINERIAQIQEPLKIEEGYNYILSNRFEDGINTLEPFLDTQFNDWWPLYYYLGVGYVRLGMVEKALESFKTVLKKNPTHLETMEELAEIYGILGDEEMSNKYQRKIDMVRLNIKNEEKAYKESTKK